MTECLTIAGQSGAFRIKGAFPLAGQLVSFKIEGTCLAGQSAPFKIESITLLGQTRTFKIKSRYNLEIIPALHLSPSRYLFIAMEAIITLLMAIFLWIIYKHTIPLEIIATAAKNIGIDLNSKPLQLHGLTIAREAFKSINEMQNKIKKLIQDRTFMLAAISHDLRTPLTSMKLRSELIENTEQRYRNQKDINEMNAMISQILIFTKEEYLLERKSKIDLVSLIVSICYEFTDRGLPVTYLDNKKETAIINGASLALKRTFTNLIDNAVKYGGSAEISIDINEEILVIIHDQGTGLLEENMDKVFTPFYRENTSRSRKNPGVGLGLAIAHNVIQAHGGTITFKREESCGFKVIVLLPL